MSLLTECERNSTELNAAQSNWIDRVERVESEKRSTLIQPVDIMANEIGGKNNSPIRHYSSKSWKKEINLEF